MKTRENITEVLHSSPYVTMKYVTLLVAILNLYTTTTTAATISRNSGCGTDRGCYDDCNPTCTFTVSWRTEGINTRFRLRSLSSGNRWMAVGFSSDINMGSDSVAECVVVGGTVRAYQSFNPGYFNSRLTSPQAGISDVTGSQTDGVFECSFLRVTAGTADSNSYDLNQNWFLLFAQGAANADFSINKHTTTPSATSQAVNLQGTEIHGAVIQGYPLVKAHGCLMVLGWVLLTSVGVVMARFYKPIWPDKTIAGAKIWFQVHRGCMIGTLLATVIAFIIIFVEAQGYSHGLETNVQKAHPILGIIVTILVIVNPIMAIFRPDPNADKRYIFNWCHFIVGRGAFILAVVTIFFGITMRKADVPGYTTYILLGYCVWQFILELVLAIIKCNLEDEGNVKPSGSGLSIQEPGQRGMSSFQLIHVVLLAVHIIVVAAFAFTVIGLIAAA